MKNWELAIGYYLMALFFLLTIFGLFSDLNPVGKDGSIIFISEFASIMVTGILLVLAFRPTEENVITKLFKISSTFMAIAGIIFALVWAYFILVLTFKNLPAFGYFALSSLLKLFIIYMARSTVEFRNVALTHFISIFILAFSTFAVGLVVSPFFCPGEKCYIADAIWGLLYFSILGTVTIYLSNKFSSDKISQETPGSIPETNTQQELARVIPKIVFGAMIGIALCFVIFALLVVFAGDSLAVKKSPCTQEFASEEWNDCTATQEFYGQKALETKNLSYCGSMATTFRSSYGKSYVGGLVIDYDYSKRMEAQCKARAMEDITYCLELKGSYTLNSGQNSAILYHKADCILSVAKETPTYCQDKYGAENVNGPKTLSASECMNIVSKARQIHDYGLDSVKINDEANEWNTPAISDSKEGIIKQDTESETKYEPTTDSKLLAERARDITNVHYIAKSPEMFDGETGAWTREVWYKIDKAQLDGMIIYKNEKLKVKFKNSLIENTSMKRTDGYFTTPVSAAGPHWFKLDYLKINSWLNALEDFTQSEATGQPLTAGGSGKFLDQEIVITKLSKIYEGKPAEVNIWMSTSNGMPLKTEITPNVLDEAYEITSIDYGNVKDSDFELSQAK